MEYTRKIVRNPQFIKDLQEKVMTAVDMTEVENDITAYKNQLSALQRSRDSLERDIDRIAPDDKYAERRRADPPPEFLYSHRYFFPGSIAGI